LQEALLFFPLQLSAVGVPIANTPKSCQTIVCNKIGHLNNNKKVNFQSLNVIDNLLNSYKKIKRYMSLLTMTIDFYQPLPNSLYFIFD